MTAVCPGCGRAKSKRAELCSDCRRRANKLGVSVVTHVAEATAVAPRLRTPQQNTVYHAKCADLAKLEQAELRTVKLRTLAHAAVAFKRPLESSTELTEIEMELLLEWLDEQLHQAKENDRAALAR